MFPIIVKKSKLASAFLLGILLQIISPISVIKAATLKESVNQSALLLSSSFTVNSLEYLGYIADSETFDLSGNFSDAFFSSSTTGFVGGNPFNLNYTGTLSGNEGSDITVLMSSNGNLGGSPISTASTLVWNFDPITNNYTSLQYQEAGSINPFWFGVIILLLIPGTLYGFSGSGNVVESPPPPPPTPPRPPKTFSGQLDLVNPSCNVNLGNSLSSSNCVIGSQNITAKLKVARTPEPTSTLSLLALGTLGAASTLKRKLKPSKSSEKETTKVS
jgi:hypothetical protein